MSNREYEQLAFGHATLPPLPSVGSRRMIKAMYEYQKVVRLYRSTGFTSTLHYLRDLDKHSNYAKTLSPLDEVRLARQYVLRFTLLGKALWQSDNCLATSLSFTAGFLVLGLNARTVIGKLSSHEQHSYPFHAWVEVGATPILEDEIISNRYRVLDVLP